MRRTDWVVVVPVKDPSHAKSRMPEHWGGVDRAVLARAFYRDTVAAVAASGTVSEVLLVTDAAHPASLVEGIPAPDGVRLGAISQADSRGLNAALAVALEALRGAPTAVVLGDLPALTSDEFSAFLAAASERPLVVADAEGTGTTALADPTGALVPRFGEGSFARHRDAGFSPYSASPLSGIRRDVDRADGLAQAIGLGVGSFTRAALGARGQSSSAA